MRHVYWLTGCLLLASVTTTLAQIIGLSPDRYHVDRINRIIISNQLPPAWQPVSGFDLDSTYLLAQPTSPFLLSQTYTVTTNSGTAYRLLFTKFPLIRLTTAVTIRRDSVVAGQFTVSDTLGNKGHSPVGVNIRGGYSSSFPKKSYKINYYTTPSLLTKKDTALFGMRNDSEWLLLAMYNEALRAQNAVSHALWVQQHTLYYQSAEPTAKPGISMRYADVFVNGTYEGVYLLTEPMDRKQLQLKKTRNDGGVRGELYKGYAHSAGTYFTGLSTEWGNRETWDGYELKYPNDTTFWANLKGLVGFAANSPSQTFAAQIAQKMNIDNLVDYFLFINVARANDNMLKNAYIARYKENEPYILIAWDLDGTWGYLWDGSRINYPNDLHINNLFVRLLSGNVASFQSKVRQRYFALRSGLYANTTLKNGLTNAVTYLQTSGAYQREALRWPLPNTTDELAYATNFIDERMAYLDALFGTYPAFCTNPPVPTVTVSSSAITAGNALTLTAAGCTETVIWNTGQSGSQLITYPRQTTSYTARCFQASAPCSSTESAAKAVSVTAGNVPAEAANLMLTTSADRRLLSVGQLATVRLLLRNDGPDKAQHVSLQSRLPVGLLYQPGPIASAGLSYADGIVNVYLNEVLPDAEQAIDVPVKAMQAGYYRLAAQVLDAATNDPDSRAGSGTADGENDMTHLDLRTPDDNSYTAVSANPNQWPLPPVTSNQPTPDPNAADLSIQLVADRRVVPVGEVVSLTVLVHNVGGLTATGVTLGGSVPNGTSFVSGQGIGWIAGLLSTTAPLTVAPGQTAWVEVKLLNTTADYKESNWQVLTASQPDPDSVLGNGYQTGEDDSATASWRAED
jgi:uncharacterized repeat protein (TIGR01451 family)